MKESIGKSLKLISSGFKNKDIKIIQDIDNISITITPPINRANFIS